MKAMKTKSVKSPINAEVLTRRVFGGELLLFDSLSATRRLVQKARRIARHCFDMQNPTHAHRRFAGKDFFERAAAAQKEFNTLAYRAIFADCLTEIGLSTNGLFRDTLGLRIAPPVKTHEGGFRSNVAVHRDTWGSGLQAQINWWLPAWPLAKERTMGFYPAHWLKPIANTTAQWSFKGFLASRKKAAPGKAAAYHSAPRALEAPDGEVSPVLPPVGSMLVFSSAHLHASIPNHTALTRFSIEIRTVALDDLHQNSGAPNVDCESKEPLTHLFRSLSDNTRLSEHF